MRNSFLLSCTLSVIFLNMSCGSSKPAHTKRVPGVWQETPVTIDGSNKDWPSPYPAYDDKAMIGYAVSNDRENLYITVETGDQATQLKILRNGLTVWIDKTGGKNEVTAINYPIPSTYNTIKGDGDRGEQSLQMPAQGGDIQKQRLAMTERIKKQIAEAREFSLEGFKACNAQFPLLERDSCGIKVSMALDEDNELVWEAVIPLKTFYYKQQVEPHDKGKELSICIETTGLTRPAGQKQPGGGRSSGGGFRPSIGMGMGCGLGMSMGNRGGMGGGGRNHSNTQDNSMDALYKSTKTFKTFGLAWKG